MQLTFDEAQVLKVLRERKKISSKQLATTLKIHTMTISKYEHAKHPIPIEVWEQLKVIYNSSLDGIGKLIDCKEVGVKPSTKLAKNNKLGKINQLGPEQEMADNIKAMRDSQLDNMLQIRKILKDLADVF